MATLTYNTRLIFKTPQDKQKMISLLEAHRFVWNEASKVHFGAPRNSIVDLLGRFSQAQVFFGRVYKDAP